MDCPTTLKLIDLCPSRSNDTTRDGIDLSAHLAECASCRQSAAQMRLADERVKSALENVDIPSGLLDRLLTSVNVDEQAVAVVQPECRQLPGPLHYLRATIVAATLLLAVGSIVWWSLPPEQAEPIPFATALDLLQKEFGRAEGAAALWEQLDRWDASTSSVELAALDSLARELRRVDPREVDLGGGPGNEAVAFQFSAGKARGILVVLPAKFTATAPALSGSPSLRQISWSSPSGDQSYVCLVHSGRVEDLLSLLRTI